MNNDAKPGSYPPPQQDSLIKRWIYYLLGTILLLTAGYMGVKNFLLFHALTEGFTIVVSFSIAFIVFNTYQNLKSDFIPIIGIAYAFAGIFDILHTLAYKGMGVFPDDVANLPTQMWVIARYLDSIGMLLAGISIGRIIKPFYVLITYAAASAVILLAVFSWHTFPLAFINGQGLTPFKVYSEYAICLILIASIILLMRHKHRFQPQVYQPLLIFFVFSILTELSFTFYKVVAGWESVIGHIFKIIAFFFLYRAVVVTSLNEPYDRVRNQARDLQEINAALEEEVMERQAAQESLRQMNAELETKVNERTSQLQDINAALEEEIAERQAIQEALLASRDALLDSEAQLKHYAAEMAETNKELKNFANIVAHDFRTPMVNMKGFSRELGYALTELKQIINGEMPHLPEESRRKLDALLEKDVPDALQFIHSSVDRLDRMLAALLKLAREGRREIINTEVDMGKLLNGVLRSFEHQITQKGIQIEVGPLPIIQTDYLAMEQIISNLLDNAIKYMKPDRPGKIAVFCTDNNDEYLFNFQDNGRGMAAEDCEKIFELFRRAGKQDVPGEGMGLTYVRTLIRQMGGKVWCESEPGVGTQIKFTLPKKFFH
ncbi:MAG TPA: MASE3 domain-containing protein [Methylomusa anaerophila]|uniref:histidine kinase n=2 Tax=Methylomusa anaerophila TaxID=1930071 RepID=A0A348AHJ5_9FIRM|nr:phytochrome-like protein cph1 [Methylomusa anaerophila]HML89816.1 MASE3 domain-containing protein [Methylomusa anaerophila]